MGNVKDEASSRRFQPQVWFKVVRALDEIHQRTQSGSRPRRRNTSLASIRTLILVSDPELMKENEECWERLEERVDSWMKSLEEFGMFLEQQ